MTTPICNFVRRYAEEENVRLHMPGHKGRAHLGAEAFDITEIDGADSLYEAQGIIKESEKNAGSLFGADTFYSTEGSSLSIRAMLYLAVLHARSNGKKPLIAATRNAHKTFVSAAALLDFDIAWLSSDEGGEYLSAKITKEALESFFESADEIPTALYVTSPDYLGNTLDLRALSEVCHRYGALLLVDNAHGSYLKFLPESRHPIDLGADACCDSAHKTLPCLTGGGYLHISKNAPSLFSEEAKNALSLFGSTSPSYLILESLDALNAYLADGYKGKLSEFVLKAEKLKADLVSYGYTLVGDEPLKLTVAPKAFGYSGKELGSILQNGGVMPEFCDSDFCVMMLTPEISDVELSRLSNILLSLERKGAISEKPPKPSRPLRVMSAREAMMSERECISVSDSLGRIMAAATVACPPAVPIVMSGERIDASAIENFKYYGIKKVLVVK